MPVANLAQVAHPGLRQANLVWYVSLPDCRLLLEMLRSAALIPRGWNRVVNCRLA
jgi:hypothetical protein